MSDDQEQVGTGRTGTVEDWTTKPVIARYPSVDSGGQWAPAVEVYVDEASSDGGWIQNFILHDGTPQNRFPVGRTGANRIDFGNAQQLIDIWATLNKGA